ncbi:MAG: diaminopimelate decarboxylase [Elusimicrobiota bacterium]
MKTKNREFFEYKDGVLFFGGVNLKELAAEFSTPLYVYSADVIKNNFLSYVNAFKEMNSMICYAVKANYNSRILEMIASLGSGADVVSGGELFMALEAGIPPEKIVFAGVGKTRREIEYAVNSGICFINIESAQEFDTVAEVAQESGKTAGVSFRINPDIDPGTHPSISTGLKKNKFGVFPQEALSLYKKAAAMDNIDVKGVHVHVGSQITSTEPIRDAARHACSFADMLKKEGIKVTHIDIGGGLGINYREKEAPSPGDIASELYDIFKERSEVLVLEPGRSIVGNAGILLTEITYFKESSHKSFAVVDAGFNDLLRPAMYGSYHRIVPVEKSGQKKIVDVVGPVCESGDFLAKSREVEGLRKGNVLAVLDAGAYGFSMSSNYNARLRPAEVMLDSGSVSLIRKRETFDDLKTGEV